MWCAERAAHRCSGYERPARGASRAGGAAKWACHSQAEARALPTSVPELFEPSNRGVAPRSSERRPGTSALPGAGVRGATIRASRDARRPSATGRSREDPASAVADRRWRLRIHRPGGPGASPWRRRSVSQPCRSRFVARRAEITRIVLPLERPRMGAAGPGPARLRRRGLRPCGGSRHWRLLAPGVGA